MWPFDYFNIYSGLISEFEDDLDCSESEGGNKTKKVFLSKWYGDSQRQKKEEKNKENKIRGLIKNIYEEKIIFYDRESKFSDAIKYRLQVTMPTDRANQDINTDILCGIIRSVLVVCDITPIAYRGSFLKKSPIFNDNVMVELGLAIAWKMPEQIIVIWDKKKCNLDTKKLPFNIQGYFVREVDFDNTKDLGDFIKQRIRDFNFKKSILIKNIKSNLDQYSLNYLGKINGLMFSPFLGQSDFNYHLEVSTIRHLLNLGIIKTEIFPAKGARTWGFYLTDLGRIMFSEKEFKINIYPKIFAEFLRVAWWMGHNESGEFDSKKEEFSKQYNNIKWLTAEDIFKKLLKNKVADSELERKDINANELFNNYARNKDFNTVNKEIVKPWICSLRALINNIN